MSSVFIVQCEWDIGLEHDVFATKELAKKAARRGIKDSGMVDAWEDLLHDSLIEIVEREVTNE